MANRVTIETAAGPVSTTDPFPTTVAAGSAVIGAVSLTGSAYTVGSVSIVNPTLYLSSYTTSAASATSSTVTLALVTGSSHVAAYVSAFCATAAPTSDVTFTLKDGSTTKWVGIIGSGASRGDGFHIPLGIVGTVTTAMTLEMTKTDTASAIHQTLIYKTI